MTNHTRTNHCAHCGQPIPRETQTCNEAYGEPCAQHEQAIVLRQQVMERTNAAIQQRHQRAAQVALELARLETGAGEGE